MSKDLPFRAPTEDQSAESRYWRGPMAVSSPFVIELARRSAVRVRPGDPVFVKTPEV